MPGTLHCQHGVFPAADSVSGSAAGLSSDHVRAERGTFVPQHQGPLPQVTSGCAWQHRRMNAHDQLHTSVVVATDGSATAKEAVDWAAREAVSRRAPLLILTACPPIEVLPSVAYETATVSMMSTALELAKARRKECHELVTKEAERVTRHHPDLEVTTEVFDGDPRHALELYEKIAAVIVLGSRGLGSIRTVLLGSVSYWATRHVGVELVVVRPADTERLAVEHAIAVGIASDASSEQPLREAFAMAARRDCSLVVANASWDAEAPGKGWKEIPLDEVDPKRLERVGDLVRQVAAEFPGVEYRLLFARGQVGNFLSELGATHEAVVLGRRRSTILDFVGLGTIASTVVEHAVGATVIVPVGTKVP